MTVTFTDPGYLLALLLLPLAWGIAVLAPPRLSPLRRRLSLVLRLLILTLLVFALAGAQLRRPVSDLTVVFLVDASDSMPAGSLERATRYMRGAIEEMPNGDRAAIVLFGKEALVERTASDYRRLDPLASVPIATRTNIADAVQLGLALFPSDMQKRLVLLSDGQENEGDAREAAALAAARNVVLDVVDPEAFGSQLSGPDVQLTSVEAPASVPLGQRFELAVRVDSTQSTSARLRVFGDNQMLYDETKELVAGENDFSILIEPSESGFRRYRAVVESVEDARPQNNEAAAFTIVTGEPRVALVTSDPEEIAPLATALEATKMQVDLLDPNEVPQTLPELAQYDSVVLANVAAPDLPRPAMEALPAFVRELGHGLVMIGGPESYGAGQWLRTPVEEALPVDMEVRPRDQEPNIALVLAVDKSGSMGRCHCDDPENRMAQQQRRISGLPKVDIAKDAIIQSLAALAPMDFIGVVAFDDAAQQVVDTAPFPGSNPVEQAIAPIEAEGGTNIFAGLSLAEESLQGVNAKVKHIILLTDGWSRAGDHRALTERFAEQGITLSVVAAGAGSAHDLELLAEMGGGKYYPAVAMEDVPQIFLKETIRIAGRYIIEEPFYPALVRESSILEGLPLNEGIPMLLGYNGSTLKPEANEILRTPQGDPLLATRRYGLGRTVAWTSDLSGRWATDWLEWTEFPAFASQLVAWSFPDPQTGDLAVQTRQEGGSIFLEVQSRNGAGPAAETRATIVGPDLEPTEMTIPQVGADRYRAELPVETMGAYFVNVSQLDEEGEPIRGSSRGFVVPYSPEYRLQEPDRTILSDLVERTGGEIRSLDEPRTVFTSPERAVTTTQPLWPWLLLAAILLFPFDVAVRRVLFGQRELENVRQWIVSRRVPSTSRREEPVLDSLLSAKRRAGRRKPAPGDNEPKSVKPPEPPTATAGQTAPPPVSKGDDATRPPPERAPEKPETGEDDTLSRLRRAKRRARR